MSTSNKVKFNLRNVHYASIEEDGSYGTPKAIKGSVSLTLDPNSETQTEYADGVAYYVSTDNQGYTGKLEIEDASVEMRQDIWGEELNADGVLVERTSQETKPVALLYQIDGDKYNRNMVLYNVTLGKPSIGSQTNAPSKNFAHDELDINAIPLEDGTVKACTTSETTETVKADWFKKVYLPKTTETR